MMSFRQRVIRPYIKGTKTSPHTGQIMTASGNPALDELLGGGIPMNSIILIEEDKFNVYAKVICKYFLAEGVLNNQEIFIACLDERPEDIIKKLPEPVYPEPKGNEETAQEFEQLSMDTTSLRIAWRYNDLPYLRIDDNLREGEHQFNLQKNMANRHLAMVSKVYWDGSQVEGYLPKDKSQKSNSPMDEGNQLCEEKNIENKSEEIKNDDEESRKQEVAKMVSAEEYKKPEVQESKMEEETMKQETEKKESEDAVEISQESSECKSESEHEKSEEKLVDSKEVDLETHTKEQENEETQVEKEKQEEDEKKKLAEEVKKKQEEEERKRQEEAKKEVRNSTAAGPNSFFTNKRYPNLIETLMKELRPKGFQRVCIPSLGSPLWYDEDFGRDLLKFLSILRALIQNSNSACFLTMPMHLIAKYDETLVPKIRNLVDYAIELESFAGSDRETNPAFKEYNGLLHFRKMSAINSLALFQHSDLAFKLRRKNFVIEKFHLPPEMDAICDQDSEEGIAKSTSGCCANGEISKDLDF